MNKFHTLYFEATRNCNFSCKYCSSGSNANKKFVDKSNYDIIKYILEPAKEIGTQYICFSGGEFLLRNNWEELMQNAVNLGFNLGLASNCSLFSEKKLEKLQKIAGKNLLITIGINSNDFVNKETRCVEYESTMKMLEKLNTYGFRINIAVVIGKINEHSFVDFLEEVKKMRMPFNRIPFVPRNCDAHDLMFTKDSLKNIFHPAMQKYFNSQVSYTPYFLPKEDYKSITGQEFVDGDYPRSPSIACWVGSFYAINAEGEVAPCPLISDHFSGGNVYKTPLKEILFESDLFKKITDRRNLEGKCKTCKYNQTCGGCRVMAYYYSNNIFAEDPTCFIDDLSEEEIKTLEKQTIKNFKNYVRMVKFADLKK